MGNFRDSAGTLGACIRSGLIALCLLVPYGSGAARPPAADGAAERGPEKQAKGGSAPVLREIRDPSTGVVWQIAGNREHPGGPGRMAPAPERSLNRPAAEKEKRRAAMILAGQKIVVEEHTPHVEASLEAVALDAADAGSVLPVRLKIGGKVVRAVAVAPGIAILIEPEAQP